jgi:hypothetical protein
MGQAKNRTAEIAELKAAPAPRKKYLLVFSDDQTTNLSRATLTAEEYEQMLAIRAQAKANGFAFICVEDESLGAVEGPEALKTAARVVAVAKAYAAKASK